MLRIRIITTKTRRTWFYTIRVQVKYMSTYEMNPKTCSLFLAYTKTFKVIECKWIPQENTPHDSRKFNSWKDMNLENVSQ